MIECQLCGTLNDEAARYCAAWNCGTALRAPIRAAPLRLSVPDWSPQLLPDRAVTVSARLGNAGSRSDTVSVTVAGPPPGCAEVRPSLVRLGPGESRTVRITLRAPAADVREAPEDQGDQGDWQVLASSLDSPVPGARARLRARLPLRAPELAPELGAGFAPEVAPGFGPPVAARPGPGVLRRMVRRRRVGAAGERVPAPVVTVLGAVVVAGLAFGGLSLTPGGPSGTARATVTPTGGGRAAGTGTPRAAASPGGAVPSGMSGTAVIALPLAGPVSSTPRLPPTPTGCTGTAAVPDVARLDYPASSRALLAAGFPGVDVAEHSGSVRPGGTLSVSPAPGTVQRCGTVVTLVYSSGPVTHVVRDRSLPAPPLCVLPPAAGVATALLDRLRSLVAADRRTPCALLVTIAGSYSATVPAGDVISEDPLPGTLVGVRSAVVLTVSLGVPVCVPPSVAGDPSAVAVAALLAVSGSDGSPCRLTVVTTSAASAAVPLGSVVFQDPPAGTAVAPGAVITLTLSSGPPPSPTPSLTPAPPSLSASPSPSFPTAAASVSAVTGSPALRGRVR
jgi:beta-lactam-binding protein with PASTA domain